MLFKHRDLSVPEIIDDPNISGENVANNLKDLALVNRWLGGYKPVISGVKKLINSKHDTLVDIGCGGGDTLNAISSNTFLKANQLTGEDINPTMIEFAKKHYPNLTFSLGDCFAFNKETNIITLNLFLHHFTDEQVITLLKLLNKYGTNGIVISDLQRSKIAYLLFKLIAVFLSPISKHDGLISIKRGFSKQDLKEIMYKAGIKNYTIKWKWAFRYQVVINKLDI